MRTWLAMHLIACVALISAAPTAESAERTLKGAIMAHLASLRIGEGQTIDAFPAGPSTSASIHFRRVQVYSGDAHIYAITASGKKELPRSNRIFLRGYSDDSNVRIAISLNADGSFADGNGSGREGSFALRAKIDAAGTYHFSAVSLKDSIPPGYKYAYQCTNDNHQTNINDSLALTLAGRAIQSPSVAASSPSTFNLAIIAVDTDSLFMSDLFSDSTSDATTWIAKLFNTMNTMYEPDLNVQLVQGTTFLRVGSDPYGSANVVPVDTTDLDVFGSYWKTNYPSVKRAFATLLSGRGPCMSCGMNCISCSASGKAWVNQYCENGFTSQSDTVGSYSVEQVFSNILVDPNADIAARLAGHELGHNFGAYHTHCTDKDTGIAPVSTNTVDQCYNGEASQNCYAGSQQCPGAGYGSIMSYCNIGACGTDNALQFNGTQITYQLAPHVSANSPSCLVTDLIFANGYEVLPP